MTEWTDAAKEQWRQYCDDIRRRLADSDADAQEVIEDVRRHVEQELAAGNAKIVTADDVRRITARIGLPETDAQSGSRPGAGTTPAGAANATAGPPNEKRSARRTWAMAIILLFGVLLPLGAVSIELVTGICAAIFFDPLPTLWHVSLFLAIPLSNAFSCWAIGTRSARHVGVLGFVNAVALGAAIIYTLMFTPILPFSVIGVIAYGLGLCGLAPLLGLTATIMSRAQLRRLCIATGRSKAPALWAGLIASVAVFAVAVVPGTVTLIGVDMALSDGTERQADGIRLLRALGDDDRLLEMCYRQQRGFGGNMFDSMIFDGPVSTRDIRGIYYRVTGKAFNTVPPPPVGFRARGLLFDDWDFEQGGENVGTRLKGLSLISSRMDGSIDADAALGYVEWTMVFRNDHGRQREARSQIQLPTGAVVSRLTLWIDGEEREAAFGSRGKTRAAYEAVVGRRRDPVLVTTAGPDRVMMQCFPVPANGGEMKVRLGITVPLQILADDETVLRLPCFNERNFAMKSEVDHSIWFESKQPIRMDEAIQMTNTEAGAGKAYSVRGEIADVDLSGHVNTLRVKRNGEMVAAWTPDPLAGSDKIIVQKIRPAKAAKPLHVVVVVDASAVMKRLKGEIAGAIRAIGQGVKITVLAAADEVDVLAQAVAVDESTMAKITADIGAIKATGGMDNVPALERAWDIAAEADGGVIVWVHGPQPHLFASADGLVQRWERRPAGPMLIDAQTMAGVNDIAEALDGIAKVSSLPRAGDLGDDLTRLFGQWKGEAPVFEVSRTRVDASDKPGDNSKETSSHLARLWAKDAVEDLRSRRGSDDRSAAEALAVNYQLVTPISGAVVLETAAQYKAAGLEPVDPETVPTIPEPEVWAMMIVAAAVLGVVLIRRRRAVVFA